MQSKLTLTLLQQRLGIARLDPKAGIPDWAADGFSSCTRTESELSIVCPEASIPEDVSAERGWVAFRVVGTLDFSEIGVLARIADVLRDAEVSVFVISTYETDYVLVRETQLHSAKRALAATGLWNECDST